MHLEKDYVKNEEYIRDGKQRDTGKLHKLRRSSLAIGKSPHDNPIHENVMPNYS